MSRLVMLDLCCGLKGASQPFLDHSETWDVITVDMEARFKPSIVADVRALPLRPFHVDLLWASPPCTDIAKWGMRCFFPNPPEPDLSVFYGIREAINTIGPRYWFVENVAAAPRFVTPIFGQVRLRTTGHALWSNMLCLFPNIPPQKGSIRSGWWGEKQPTKMRGRPMDRHKRHSFGTGEYVCWGREAEFAAKAAVIPYEIGDTIRQTVERELAESYGKGENGVVECRG